MLAAGVNASLPWPRAMPKAAIARMAASSSLGLMMFLFRIRLLC